MKESPEVVDPTTSMQENPDSQPDPHLVDPRTGLASQAYFHLALSREMARSERFNSSFTLALLALTPENEPRPDKNTGHVAAILGTNLRQVDLVCRLQPHLYAMLVIESTARELVPLFERMEKQIGKAGPGVEVAGIGLVSYPGGAADRDELFRQAEKKLEQARRGDTKICCAEDFPAPANFEPAARILIVDDERSNVRLLEALIAPLGHETIKAYGGREALACVDREHIDLVLLDIMMPDLDGFAVCRTLKNREKSRMIPIVMVTALDDLESKIKGIEAGADDFLTKPPNKLELQARLRSLFKSKRLNDKLISIETVLCSLANVVEAKDAYTQGHVQRVAKMALALGCKMGLSERELEALKLGGILHDIGKIAIPRAILNKPGPLSPAEWELMMTHATVGYKVCLPLKENLGMALEVIRHHHEKMDGSGYPDGLRGEEIAMVARIMAVVDIFDAMTTQRPYRKALSSARAMAELRKEADHGRLDKNVIEIFARMLSRDEDEGPSCPGAAELLSSNPCSQDESEP